MHALSRIQIVYLGSVIVRYKAPKHPKTSPTGIDRERIAPYIPWHRQFSSVVPVLTSAARGWAGPIKDDQPTQEGDNSPCGAGPWSRHGALHCSFRRQLPDAAAPAALRRNLQDLPNPEQAARIQQESERAQAAVDRGDLEQARMELLQLVAETPGSAQAHLRLGKILQLQGRLDESETCFRRALRSTPTSSML